MPLAPRTSSLASPDRVEFTLENFKDALKEHGVEILWSKATFCPNQDPTQPGHHRLNCPLCDANGFVYYDPISILALMTSFSLSQTFLPESRYEPGVTYVTADSVNKLSFWDKLELEKSKARFSEVVESAGVTYTLKYKVLVVIHVLTSAGTVIDPATITVNPDGTITFTANPGGDFFSISYEQRPTYLVIDMLHHIRDRRQTVLDVDTLVEFPTQVSAKLDFLIRDESVST